MFIKAELDVKSLKNEKDLNRKNKSMMSESSPEKWLPEKKGHSHYKQDLQSSMK